MVLCEPPAIPKSTTTKKGCLIELVYAVIYWLKTRTTGLHKIISVQELMTEIPQDASKDFKFQFMEQPILVHVDETGNTIKVCAVDALYYLRPLGSVTECFFAFDTNTCNQIHPTTTTRSATATPLTGNLWDAKSDTAILGEAIHAA